MAKEVVVIGGGVAGMECAIYLSSMGYKVTLLEEKDRLGGHLLEWEKLSPTGRCGSEVVEFLLQSIEEVSKKKMCKVMLNTKIRHIEKTKGDTKFKITLEDSTSLDADAIVVATGYEVFDAKKKEEYGYGIYENVITSKDLEKMFLENNIKTASGSLPKRIGFVHCVGSRDEKAGNLYCSQVCCITAIKQASEIRERWPQIEVFCFYMDLRMFGRYYEEAYLEAQEKYSVNFIRGRVSEIAEDQDKTLIVKLEDTLLGRPLKLSCDLVVLLVGFVPSEGTKNIEKLLNLERALDGFIKTQDEHTMTNNSNREGVFLAGACTGPKCITATITDARAAAAKVASFLENYCIEERVIKK